MMEHDPVSSGTVAGFQRFQILSVLLNGLPDPASGCQGVLGGQADQIEKALENLIKSSFSI